MLYARLIFQRAFHLIVTALKQARPEKGRC